MLGDLPTAPDELREVIGSMDIPRAIWPAMYALLAAPPCWKYQFLTNTLEH